MKRSAIQGIFQIRKYVGLGIWDKLSISRNAWWKTPKVASTQYVLVVASFAVILTAGDSRIPENRFESFCGGELAGRLKESRAPNDMGLC
jgi:hypothetical protein